MMKLENKKTNNFKWRKIIFFFAAFFCVYAGLTSCKKKEGTAGKGLLPNENIMSSKGIDTFSIYTYTVVEDSIVTMNPEFNLLGSYNDNLLGEMEASFYTQLTLSGFSPDFGNLSNVRIDSAIMAFEYGGYYGTLNEQLFEVYEVLDNLSEDSSYTRTSSLQIGTQNLIPTDNNQGLIKPNTGKPTVIGNDTIAPQLRLPMDTVFIRTLMQYAQNSTTDKVFLENFKGLYFKVNNGFSLPGKGSILYLASSKPLSKLTVYYRDENNGKNKYDFIITGKAVDFNRIEVNYSGSKLDQILADSTLGQEEFYVQAFTTRAKIDFSQSIKNLPKDIIIHSATLELPVSYYTGDGFYPSSTINVTGYLFKNDKNRYLITSANYSSYSKSYVIDLRAYMQKIIKGEVENNGIYVTPKNYIASAERIAFNGANSLLKKKPKLNIVYTKL